MHPFSQGPAGALRTRVDLHVSARSGSDTISASGTWGWPRREPPASRVCQAAPVIKWEVLLTNGDVHVVNAVEPAAGDNIVRFWNLDNELVATYVLRNIVGWRPRADDLGSWPAQ